jgi:class 3 adenylate cyclase
MRACSSCGRELDGDFAFCPHCGARLAAPAPTREQRKTVTVLFCRIGVNTGEVVTGTEERLATGDAVNVAARLEQAAQPGEVLLGEETLLLVRDLVQAEPVSGSCTERGTDGRALRRWTVSTPRTAACTRS